jgi:hypothetical protein
MKKQRTLNGYAVIYFPGHPKAMKSKNWNGYVYEHIVLAEHAIKRSLLHHEVVHHLDQNKSNNRPENLLVLESSQHAKLHNWLKKCKISFFPSNKKETRCMLCQTILLTKQKEFCSKKCSGIYLSKRKVAMPSKEELNEKLNHDNMSWLALGRHYGVSDNAVRKWARKLGLL